jgi:hypothetical protein
MQVATERGSAHQPKRGIRWHGSCTASFVLNDDAKATHDSEINQAAKTKSDGAQRSG